MTMKFIQEVPEGAIDPIAPDSGAVSVLSGTLSGIDDGAVAIATITLQGLGPNTSRVTATLTNPTHFASGVIDKAVVDVPQGAFVRIHLSGADVLSSGSANYEAFVSVEEGTVQLYRVDADEKPMSKLVIFGGVANGA